MREVSIAIIITLQLFLWGCSQSPVEESIECCSEDDIFVIVQDMPRLANQTFLNSRARFPVEALSDGKKGRVHIEHIINKIGVTTVNTIKKGLCASCEEEALRLAEMARYAPGLMRGEPVCVKISFRVDFILADSTVHVAL